MKNKPGVFKYILFNLALAAVYFIFAKLGLKLAFVNESATVIWPPTGISLASLIIFGYWLWPGVFIGAFFSNITTAGTILTSLGIAGGNTLEALIGCYLINKYAHDGKSFDNTRDILKFGIFTGLVATPISATIGVSSLVLGEFVKLNEYWSVWFTWWLGDLGGALIIAPFLILWSSRPIGLSKKKVFELISYLLAVVLISQIVFSHWVFEPAKHYPLEFLLVPILLLVAIRLGKKETALVIVSMSGIAIFHTLHGYGPFAVDKPEISLLLLQSFLIIIFLPKMLIASYQDNLKEIDRAKSEFISVASHQLRAPLVSISWLVDSLRIQLEKKGLGSEEEKTFDELDLSVKKAKASVEDLLNLARINLKTLQINKDKLDIKQALEDFIRYFLPYAKSRKHELNLDIKTHNLPDLLIDKNIFLNVLQNLLSNAVNYSPENTKVNVILEKEQDFIKISVVNYGEPIPAEEKNNIFHKFYRGKAGGSKSEGSGLGLYIVRNFVEDMGGKVGFESNQTETTFWFKIPINK